MKLNAFRAELGHNRIILNSYFPWNPHIFRDML